MPFLDGPRGLLNGQSVWGLDAAWAALLHDLSDLAIFASYVAIALVLAYFYSQVRRQLPLNWVLVAFALFIVSCGFTHLMHVLIAWGYPILSEAALIQTLTVASSAATALLLPFVVPKAVRLIHEARLSEERHRLLLETEVALAELRATQATLRAEVTARDEFLAIAAHELRTPLTGLHGYIQIALRRIRQADSVPPLREQLQKVELESSRVNALVETLMNVATIDMKMLDLAPVVLDVSTLVREVVESVERASGRAIDARDVQSPCRLAVDPVRFAQVLQNLLGNALKFSSAGERVEVALRADSSAVILSVRDYGPGIPPEQRDHLFEKYRRGLDHRSHPGLGLGLYVARALTEAHGGTLVAEDAAEGGSRFVASFPTAAHSVTQIGDTSTASPHAVPTLTPVVEA